MKCEKDGNKCDFHIETISHVDRPNDDYAACRFINEGYPTHTDHCHKQVKEDETK